MSIYTHIKREREGETKKNKNNKKNNSKKKKKNDNKKKNEKNKKKKKRRLSLPWTLRCPDSNDGDGPAPRGARTV